MSHLPERKEKICLNCQASIHGRFCHICGQENIEPKENFWHLVTHFVYDITHFDGKFFSTLRYLLFKPGYLSHEYLKGRRADYLHPIRMYVFTSAFFFLIFFSLNKEDAIINSNESKPTAAALLHELQQKRSELAESLKGSMPDIAKKSIKMAIEATDSDLALIKRDSTAKSRLKTLGTFNSLEIGKKHTLKDSMRYLYPIDYKNIAAYDSMQKQLPVSQKDNFFERGFARQSIYLKEKYHNDKKAIVNAILNKFRHLFPQMLFVSLPLFALVLQLLYVRKINFFYVNHVVYTIHLYCATFIIILTGIGADHLGKAFGYKGNWIGTIFTIAGFFYWYKAMRNFYEQRRGKTILKYVIVLFLSLIIMILLFLVFLIFSALSI